MEDFKDESSFFPLWYYDKSSTYSFSFLFLQLKNYILYMNHNKMTVLKIILVERLITRNVQFLKYKYLFIFIDLRALSVLYIFVLHIL